MRKASFPLFIYIGIFVALFFSCNRPDQFVSEKDKQDMARQTERVDDLISQEKFREVELLIDSFSKANQNKNIFSDFKILEMRRQLAFERKNYVEAIRISDEIIDLIGEDDRFIEDHIYALFVKGDIYYTTGNYQSAYTNLFNARKLAEKLGDSCSMGNYDYRIAMALFRQEKYKQAADYFISGHSNFNYCNKNFPNKLRQQEILNNIALCYYKLKQYENALTYYHKAHQSLQQIESEKQEQKKFKEMASGVIDGNIGKTLMAMGKPEQAIPYLQKNISVNLRYQYDQRDAFTSLLALAEIQLKEKKFREFESSMTNAYLYLDSVGNDVQFKKNILKLWGEYYLQTNRANDALHYYMQYAQLSDSLMLAEKYMTRNDIQTTIEGLNRELELSLLKRANDVKDRNFLFIVVILCLVIIIAALIMVSWVLTKRKNKTLASLNTEIKIRDVEKDRILSIVAHDLRNPISGIKLLSEILSNSEEDEEKKESLEMIQISCANSLELINEILTYTQLQNDAANEKDHYVSFNQFITQTVAMSKYRAEEKKQELLLDLPEDDIRMRIYPEKLRRALSNVILNAIKFSHNHTDILVSLSRKENNLEISVTDHGIGIPSKLEDKLFDAFTKSQRVGTNGEKPFGLGLSIVKQIIELHKGKIWYKSEVDKGTTFFILLPIS